MCTTEKADKLLCLSDKKQFGCGFLFGFFLQITTCLTAGWNTKTIVSERTPVVCIKNTGKEIQVPV